MVYSVVGAGVLTHLTGRMYLPQAGSLTLACDPESEWSFMMDGSSGLAPSGEFHCWAVEVPDGVTGPEDTLHVCRAGSVTFIDLSARHYRTMVARSTLLSGQAVEWKVEAPPAFVWDTRLPPWLSLRAEPKTTRMLLSHMPPLFPWVRDALDRLPNWCRPRRGPRRTATAHLRRAVR